MDGSQDNGLGFVAVNCFDNDIVEIFCGCEANPVDIVIGDISQMRMLCSRSKTFENFQDECLDLQMIVIC
jgi:hypothetical protein